MQPPKIYHSNNQSIHILQIKKERNRSDDMSSDSKKSVPVASATKKLEAQGGKKGDVWNDGHHDNVKKVSVGLNHDAVVVKFEYFNRSQDVIIGAERGKKTELGYHGFNLKSDEYITSVEGTYEQILGTDGDVVTMLLFKTSKNKTHGPYGIAGKDSTKLTLKKEGYKVVGFHGQAGESLNAIGAYFAPIGPIIPLTPATRTLKAYGGSRGTLWDDGANYDGIRKVYVGKDHSGGSNIGSLKFEYVSDSKVVVGDEHGVENMVSEFEVDKDDYIVYVEGYRTKIDGDEIVKSLKFKTYKGKSSHQFGYDFGEKFVLQGGRIVGFHGRSTDVLISLGAHISSSSTPPDILGEWIKMDQDGKGPGRRCSHAITQIKNKIYSFGGDKVLYVFDIEKRTWSSISKATGEGPNVTYVGVCMVSVGSILYVFGSRDDNSKQYNDFYSFDTIKNEWKRLTSVEEGPIPIEDGPFPYIFYSMAADENNVYVFGGVNTMKSVNTLHSYNIADQKWVQCSTPGKAFSIRRGAGLQVVGKKIWVIYGYNGRSELDDIYCYDIAQDKWEKEETNGEKPSERSAFASAVLGKHIVIFGGEIDKDPQDHVGPGQLAGGTFALDLETNVWEMVDKLGGEKETPDARGWAASTAGTINGKKGLVMLGGKAQNNTCLDDLCFFGVESVYSL